MNPGLVVKLRPAGPWRIGPESGARNRVDMVYHSDSLYSAVTGAMARLGSLEEWLDATARGESAAVCFSSCFPFVDEIGFVVPPRTMWPPSSPAMMSARVRWKSARFVPLGIVQSIVAGQPLHEDQWAVDGPSECLVPAGRSGPFRTSLRGNAAVDRLTGATERHSIACLEFRPGAGLWTVVSFRDEDARARWSDPLKAAFRLLADSGFGGERSRGWGRAEAPEFIEGSLPDMILPAAGAVRAAEAVVEGEGTAPSGRGSEDGVAASDVAASEVAATDVAPPDVAPLDVAPGEGEEPQPAAEEPPATEAAAPVEEPSAEPAPEQNPPERDPVPEPLPGAPSGVAAHWLLSLFAPGGSDAVDWQRGNYTLVARSGRVESPAGSGELKKHVQMVTEGSVIYAARAPRGSAPDVAPEGFAHPVFRAGFAVAIPLPEAR